MAWKNKLHFGSVLGVGWCTEADLPRASCRSPTFEMTKDWTSTRVISVKKEGWIVFMMRNQYDQVMVETWTEKDSWLFRITQSFHASSCGVILVFSRDILMWGYINRNIRQVSSFRRWAAIHCEMSATQEPTKCLSRCGVPPCHLLWPSLHYHYLGHYFQVQWFSGPGCPPPCASSCLG